MSQPNNPPSNPLLGAIYIDQVTNVAWVWTGTYWVQADSATGYNAQVGPGATLVPGYYADPSPEDWFPFVGNTPPASPQPGQIWVDTTTVPYTSYVWDSNLGQFIALGGGPGADTNSIVSTVAPTNRVSGAPLETGDLWLEPTSSLGSYWTGSAWAAFSSPDTHSILSANAPVTRTDGSPLNVGDLWLDLDNNAIQYYNGVSFVPVTAVSENIQIGATAPTLRSNGDPLVAGDLWTNTTNGASYYYNGSTFVTHLDVSSIEATSAPTANATGDPLKGGDQWYNPTTKFLYTYDSTVPGWVQVNTDTHGLVGSGDPITFNPISQRPDGNPLQSGDQYFDTAAGGFYVYNGTAWNSLISADTHSFVAAGDPSTVAPYNTGVRPDSTALLTGDQYIDSATDIAYYWTGSAWEQFGNDTHSFLGSAAPTLTLRPDGNPLQNGDQFIDQVANKFYYYTGTVWKEIGADTHSIRATTAPAARLDGTPLKDGDMWVDTDNGNVLSVYNIGLAQWEAVGADTHAFSGTLAPTLTLRPDGQALLVGDQYFNTTNNYVYSWNGSAWVTTEPDTHSIRATTAPGVKPSGAALVDGDMWVDTDNGNILYVYNFATSTWDLVGPDTHSFTGTGAPALTLRPDGSALLTGDQYLDTVSKLLYAYDGAAWVVISGDSHAFTGNGVPALTTRPDNSALVEGDQYVDKVSGLTYAYYSGVWNLTGSDLHSFLGTGDPTLIARPDGTPLQDGDQYINKVNKQAWYYDAGIAAWQLQTADTHAFVDIGDPVVANPVTARPDGTALVNGDQYVDSNNDVLYYWNNSTWEILSGDGHSFEGNGVPTNINFPTRPDTTPLIEGDQYIDKNTELLYHWDGGTWEQVNPDTHTITGTGEPVSASPVTTRPNTSPLLKGDLYIDEATEYLYYYTGTTWDRITSAETHSFTGNGLPNVIIGTANRPDGDPLVDGDQYFNTASNLLYTYIAGTWILTSLDTHSFSGAVIPSDPTSGVNAGLRPDGTTLLVGDQYIDTATQLLYSWYGGQWNVISGDTHSFISNVDPASAGSGVDTGTRPDGTPLKAGDMYVNTVTDEIWYYDTGLSQWVNTTVIDTHSFTGNGTPYITTSNPTGALGTNQYATRNNDGVTALLEGDLYWDKATNILYGFNSTEWVPVSDDLHSIYLGTMTNVFPTAPNVRDDNTLLRFGDQATSKDKRLFTWTEDASGVGLHGWRQIVGYYRMSLYGSTLDPNTNAIYNTRSTGDGTIQGVLQGDMYVDSNSLGLWVSDGLNWERVNIDTHAFTGNGVPALTKRPANDAGFQNDLLTGDLYVDTATDKIYYYNGAAWVALTAEDTHSFTGSGAPTLLNRPDGSALLPGDQYLDTSSFTLYGRNAANTNWVLISNDTHSILGNVDPGVGTLRANGTSPQLGDNYINTATESLFYYDGASWNPASNDTHSFTGTVNPTVAGSLVDGGNRPNGTTLVVGDQYINTTTDTIFYWDGANWDALSTTDLHSFHGTTAPQGTVTTRPDGSPLLSGDQYFDTQNRGEYVYNATFSKWEFVRGAFVDYQPGTPFIATGSNPTTGRDSNTPLRWGDLYIDANTGYLYVWDGGAWNLASKDTHSFTGPGAPSLTTRPDGSDLIAGDIYIREPEGIIYYWTGASWEPISQDTHSFTGTVDPSVVGSGVSGGNRPDLTPLVIGDQYINTSTDALWYWNGTAWEQLSTPDTHSTTGSGNPNSTAPFNAGFRADGTTAAIDGDIYFDLGEFPSVIQYVYDTSTTTWHPLSDFHTYTGGGHPTLSPYSTGTTGKMYVNNSTNEFYFWDGTSWDLLGPNETQYSGVSPTLRSNGIDSLVPGDIWYDTTTGRLYRWPQSGSWYPTGPFTFVQNTTPPLASTFEKDLWVDTTDMTMYVYYNDGATTQWVTIA